jgi:hypothetical protein
MQVSSLSSVYPVKDSEGKPSTGDGVMPEGGFVFENFDISVLIYSS